MKIRPPRNDHARRQADEASGDVAINALTFLDPEHADSAGERDRRTVEALEAIVLELRAARWDREGVMETDEKGRRLDMPLRSFRDGR